MHLTPNMYKTVTLEANAKRNCYIYASKWLLMLQTYVVEIYIKLCRVIHDFFPSCDICICKCSPWEFSDKCDQVLYYCSFLHLQCSHSCTLKIHIAVEEITEDRKVRLCMSSSLWRQMLQKIVTVKCIWHQVCTVQNCYFEGKCSGHR